MLRRERRISSDRMRTMFEAQTDPKFPRQADRPDRSPLDRHDFLWRTVRAPLNHSRELRRSRQFRQCPRFLVRRKYAPYGEIVAISIQGRVRGRRCQRLKFSSINNRSGTVEAAVSAAKHSKYQATRLSLQSTLISAIQQAGSATPISRCGE